MDVQKNTLNEETLDQERLVILSDYINQLREKNTIKVSRDGIEYSIMQPSPKEYSGMQWKWDSCFHAIMNSQIDLEHSKSELKSLNVHQLQSGPDEGMYPHMSFWTDRKLPQFKYQDQSWITQPPVVALAAEHIFNKEGDPAFLQEMYPHLVKQEQWFVRRREIDSDGLVVVISPWETGCDQSKRFKNAIPKVREEDKPYLDDLRKFISEDLRKYAGIENHQYKGEAEMSRHILNRAILERNADATVLKEDGFFTAYNADFNFIRMRSLLSLAKIAGILNKIEDQHQFLEKHEQIKQSVNERLWDSESASYRDIILHDNVVERPPSNFGSFLALLAKACDKVQEKQIIESLSDQKKYLMRYGVSTEDVTHKESDPNDYWGANIWPQTAWLISEGLYENGYLDLYAQNTRGFSDAVIKSGPYEFFNPIDGRGLGEAYQSWAGLSFSMQADLINRLSTN